MVRCPTCFSGALPLLGVYFVADSSLGGPLYLLAKAACSCLTGQEQRPFSFVVLGLAVLVVGSTAGSAPGLAWRIYLNCSLLLAEASRQTAGPYGLSCLSTPAPTRAPSLTPSSSLSCGHGGCCVRSAVAYQDAGANSGPFKTRCHSLLGLGLRA